MAKEKPSLPQSAMEFFQHAGKIGGKKSHTHFNSERAKAAIAKRWAKERAIEPTPE